MSNAPKDQSSKLPLGGTDPRPSALDMRGAATDASADPVRLRLLDAIRVHESGKQDEAEQLYRALLPMGAHLPRIELNLGILLRQKGLYDASLAHLSRLYQAHPNSPNILSALGNTLRELSRIDEALHLHRRAIELAPDLPLAHYNLGCTLWDHGRTDLAIRAFEHSAKLAPPTAQIKVARAQALLTVGRWELGYRAYGARWQLLPHKHRHKQLPQWNGEALGGKTLLIWAEQGMGDSLHFCRYLDFLRGLDGRIVFEVDAPLVELMRAAPFLSHVEIVPMGEAVLNACVQRPLMDLPLLSEPDPTRWQMPCPYLNVPPEHAYARPLPKQGNTGLPLHIGLSWAGKPSNENDHKRSMSLKDMMPLLDLPHVRFHSLQKGVRSDEAAQLGVGALVPGMGMGQNNFMETAAAVDALDLVVTIDSSVGHLAGALGKPVFDLLTYCPDWRWGQRGASMPETTPWYPSMRLFRQTKPGSWREPVLAVREAILALIRQKMS